MRSSDDFAKVRAGDVLVCPLTNAAWTVLFPRIAALVTDSGEALLRPGMAAGFPKGEANAHHLVNRTEAQVLFLVIGGRSPTDEVFYPDIDMQITGGVIRHKDGTPWEK